MSQPDHDPSSTENLKAEGGLSGIGGAIRPLVKELIKVGLVTYETVSDTASGIGKQFNKLVEEARSEAGKSPPSHPAPAEKGKKAGGNKSGKGKDAN